MTNQNNQNLGFQPHNTSSFTPSTKVTIAALSRIRSTILPNCHNTLTNLRLFSTKINITSDYFTEKLVINSTYDNIVFEDLKSILFLPSICLIDKSVSQYKKDEFGRTFITNDMLFVSDQDSLFFKQLLTILKNLSSGVYKFDFYFYIEGETLAHTYDNVYNFNGLDTKTLFKWNCCNYGYKMVLTYTAELGYTELLGYNNTLEWAHLTAVLGSGLTKIEQDREFNIMHRDIHRQVLLVINKKTKECDQNLNNKNTDLYTTYSNDPVSKLDGLSYPKFNKINPTNVLYSNRGRFYTSLNPFKKFVRNYSTENQNNESLVSSREIEINTKAKVKSMRTFNIWMDFSCLTNNRELFYNTILEHELFRFNVEYGVIAKAEFRGGVFRTFVGSTRLFCESPSDIKQLDDYYDKLSESVLEFLNRYKQTELISPDSLVLEFFGVTTDTKYTLSDNARKLIKDKEFYSLKLELNLFESAWLNDSFKPSDFDKLKYKYPLLEFNKEGFLEPEHLELEGFNPENIKVYLKDKKLKYYHIHLRKYKGQVFVTINAKLNNSQFLRAAFNDKGYKIIEIIETFQLDKNIVTRSRGNILYTYSQGKLLLSERLTPLKPIVYKDNSKKRRSPNQAFGTLDLETFNFKDLARVYASGYYTNDPKELQLFYIERDFDSFKLIHNTIDALLRNKYKGKVFYVHNLGNFDSIFIIKALSEYNQFLPNPYSFECVNRDKNTLKLTINRAINKKKSSITLLDSAAMLPLKLADLCKSYELEKENTKGVFPYDFVNERTLEYVGKTPDKIYYPDLKPEEYKGLVKDKWNLKFETMKYLKLDLTSLHEILRIVNKNMFLLFDVQMTESITITSLALKILYTKYNKGKVIIPSITDKDMYKDLKNSYYGGRVEIFKPYGRNLYYYDVNSLYPYAALGDIPGLEASYIELFNYDIDIKELFGFFYCKVTTPQDNPKLKYLGLLPYRNRRGSLSFPIGSWEGWYFSEELNYAASLGYDIKVIKGYKFNRIKSPLKPYITALNSIKANPKNKAEREIAKLLMNSSLGRFGMDPDKPISKLVNTEEHNWLLTTRHIFDSRKISEDLYLDTCSNGPIREVCEQYNLDYNKVRTKENSGEARIRNVNNFSSVSTASAVLSHARIHMMKAMNFVMDNGGTIYYTDTDSLVTDFKLPEEWVSSNILGKFKLEHFVEEAIFLSEKFYALRTNTLDKDGNKLTVLRTKGIKRTKVNWDIMKDLYKSGDTFKTEKIQSIKNREEGSVVIKASDLELTLPYHKRIKVRDLKGLWIDSIPLVLNESTLSTPEVSGVNSLAIIKYEWRPKLALVLYVIYIQPLYLSTYNRILIIIPFIIFIHPLAVIRYKDYIIKRRIPSDLPSPIPAIIYVPALHINHLLYLYKFVKSPLLQTL